jgi:hypothetical protein
MPVPHTVPPAPGRADTARWSCSPCRGRRRRSRCRRAGRVGEHGGLHARAAHPIDRRQAYGHRRHGAQGPLGGRAAKAAADQLIFPGVVRLPEAKRGFILLRRRYGQSSASAWVARSRGSARDCERLPATRAGLRLIAFRVPHRLRAVDFAAVCIGLQVFWRAQQMAAD